MYVENFSKDCNGEKRTVLVYYEDSKRIDSTNYIYDKYSYERCEGCTFSECPVYNSAPQHVYLPR